MPRTTPTLVAGIIEVDPNIDLTPFIFPANELVTQLLTSAGFTPERLELIERYLAAHFYTLRDPRPTSEQAGSVGTSYQNRVDLYLCTSHYGQMAIILDTSGALSQLNMQHVKRKLSVTWLGESPDEKKAV